MPEKEDIFKSKYEMGLGAKELVWEDISYFEKDRKKYVKIMDEIVETETSPEDIEKCKTKIIECELSRKVLNHIALCYNSRLPLILEGPPAAGKTFLLRYFHKLLYGYDSEPLTIYGTTQTTPEDILGHFVPKVEIEDEKSLWDKYLKDAGEEEIVKLYKEELKSKKDLSEIEQQRLIREKIEATAERLIRTSGDLRKFSSFEFKEGPLIKAYSGNNGKGRILICEEWGLIPSNVQSTLMQIRGEEGELSKILHLPGYGKEVYPLGEKTWIAFATNPVSLGMRAPTERAMATGLEWHTILPEETKEYTEALADSLIFDKVMRKYNSKELAAAITLSIKTFHVGFDKAYRDGAAEPDREQKFELTAREFLSVLGTVLERDRNQETGELDLITPLKTRLKQRYIWRLTEKKFIEQMEKFLEEVFSGRTSPGYNLWKKTLEEKINEEIEKIDPIKRKRIYLEEIDNAFKDLYQPSHRDLEDFLRDKEFKEIFTDYSQKSKEIQELRKSGKREKDIEQSARILEGAKNRLEELVETAKNMKKYLNEKKKLIKEINDLKSKLG